MMNRLQLSPQSSTHDALPLNDWRSALPASWEDARRFRSWLVYGPGVRPGLELPRINWYKLLGITLATAFSGGVWAGIWLLAAHIWK
jgi:hypothetical protein